MSTDFSIKPVGAPVATPFVQPASPAAEDAIATQLPPSAAVTAADAGARMRNDTQSSSDTVSHHAVIDRAANAVVYQVVDNRTSLVVRQFPDEAALRRRAYFHALDLIKDDRPRIRFTDRSA